MKKVFTLLLAEVKKLGATVIHADMQTITIATGKNRLASAAAFVDGLRASLRRRELFSWLELEPSRQWHSLLFRGPYDYGGLLASALPGAKQWSGHDTLGPDDFELDPKTTGANGVDDAAEALDMHWNIASFLPESIREHFEVVVSSLSSGRGSGTLAAGSRTSTANPSTRWRATRRTTPHAPGAQRPEHRSGGRGRRSVGLHPAPARDGAALGDVRGRRRRIEPR
jgi:hypothetical protein